VRVTQNSHERVTVLMVMFVVCWLLGRGTVLAEHTADTAFLKHYTGRGNQGCCGVNDCQEATVVVLEEGGNESVVMIGKDVITIPNAWLHRSKDPKGRGWWCFVVPSAPYGESPTYRDADGHVRAVPPERATRDNTRCVFYTSMM